MKAIIVLCRDCRFWGKQPPATLHGGGWSDAAGLCGKIYEGGWGDGEKAETFNHFGDDSGLRTHADFGCVSGEEKPQ